MARILRCIRHGANPEDGLRLYPGNSTRCPPANPADSVAAARRGLQSRKLFPSSDSQSSLENQSRVVRSAYFKTLASADIYTIEKLVLSKRKRRDVAGCAEAQR